MIQQIYPMRPVAAVSVILAFIAALSAIVWGLFSQTFFAGGIAVGDFGWHVFAFSSGLFLLSTPAILPFALTVIPLALKRRVGSAVVLVFAFSIGTLLTLTAFGFFAGLLGYIGYDVFVFSLESLASIGLLVLGATAYLFALGEVDLVHIARGVVGEKISRLFTRKPGAFGAFMLGIFLASINMHPATLVLLSGIVLRGDPIFGSSLMLIHACGRIIPLLIIVALAALHMDASEWINERKERARMILGWLLVCVSGVLLNAGLWAWLKWLGVGSSVLQLFAQHYVLALLWLIPLWVLYFMESRRVYGSPLREWKSLERSIDRAERERRALEHAAHFPESENGRHIEVIEHKIDMLEKRRRIAESALRHEFDGSLHSKEEQRLLERLLFMHFAFTVTCSLLVVTVLALSAI